MLPSSGPVRSHRATAPTEPIRNRLSSAGLEESPREIEFISSLQPEPGVLIADDDRGVRAMLALLLPKHGFVVWQAQNGREAIELYLRERDRIGVVLMDVCMPEMDGPRALRALRELAPQVRCCFMSGHGGAYTDEELMEMGAASFFPKPFRLADLVRVLKELTAEGPEPGPARQVFRVGPAEPPGTERRAQVRHVCQLPQLCRPAGIAAAAEIWSGWVRDLSVGGLRVQLSRRFEPGTLLAVEIAGADRDDVRRLLARVVRAAPEPDGQWGLGCSFISDLSEGALRALLASTDSPTAR